MILVLEWLAMLAQIIRGSMTLTAKIVFFMIFYGYFGIAFSQEASVDDPVFDQPITEEVQEKVQDSGQQVLIDSDSNSQKEPPEKTAKKTGA